MSDNKFLDLEGLSTFKDKVMEQIDIKTGSKFALKLNEEDGSLSLIYDDTTL